VMKASLIPSVTRYVHVVKDSRGDFRGEKGEA